MKTVITIGRQYGSGGREIGKTLAEKLGIPYYDKELLNRVAKDSGFCEEMIQAHDERPTNSFLYNIVMDTYSFGYNSAYVDMPMSQKVFLAQFDSIKKIAAEGACVIVGRCADYALAENPNVLNIFIYGQEDKKAVRISKKYDISLDDAKDRCRKRDKQRQSYYNYYASKRWGHADTYDLCVDSGVLGIDGTVDLLEQFINCFEKNKA